MNKYALGREGFIWWIGVVEDRQDPDQLGRVRVRCFGWHTDDKGQIPTESLPWALPVHSVNVPASYAPKEGDWVVGFFADGSSAQKPFVFGVLMGAPQKPADTSKGFSDPAGVQPKRLNESTMNRLIRNRIDGTIHETRKRSLKRGVRTIGSMWNEPSPPFSPQYPFNFSMETESGHAFELDDTMGAERVNLAHKNGSFIEMDASGNQVNKIVKDRYTIVAGTDYVSIDGVCNVTVAGACNLKVGGILSAEAQTINLNAIGDVKIRAGKRLALEGTMVDLKSKSTMRVGAGAALSLGGKLTNISGKPLTLGGKITNIVKTPHGPGKIIPMGSASAPANTGLRSPMPLSPAASVSSLTGGAALPALPAIPKIGIAMPAIPNLPSLPSLPKIPSVPQLPAVPKLPDLAAAREAALSKVPSIPNVPNLPSLSNVKLPTVPTLPNIPSKLKG